MTSIGRLAPALLLGSLLLAGCLCRTPDFHFAHDASDLRGFDPTITYVSIRGLPDDDVGGLERLKDLRSIDFGDGWKAYPLKMTRRGFHRLTDLDLPNWKTLILRHCPSVDDACLREIGRRRTLQHVDLGDSDGFTAAGLRHVLDIPTLSSLDLRRCRQVDDTWVDGLASCKTLKQLGTAATSISPAGVARLRAALPDCHVDDDVAYVDVALDRASYPGWAGPPERRGP